MKRIIYVLLVLAMCSVSMTLFGNPDDMIRGLTFEILEGDQQNVRLVWDTPASYNHVGPIIEGMDLYLYEVSLEFNGRLVNRFLTQDTRLTMIGLPFGDYRFSVVTQIYELKERVTSAGAGVEAYVNAYVDAYVNVYANAYVSATAGAKFFGNGATVNADAGVESGVVVGLQTGVTASAFASISTNEYTYFVKHISSSQPVSRTREIRDFGAPRNLSWEVNSHDKVVLHWQRPESQPNAQILHYRVYKNGLPEFFVAHGHTFIDDATFPGFSYSYHVTTVYQLVGETNRIRESAPSQTL
jgi:hypothetical protein